MIKPMPIGESLKEWRQRRRLSQLDLAVNADVSQRHLSFVESGRALPSRDMVLHLAEQLEVPLRERNLLLLAAGYAPVFQERALSDGSMRAARQAIELLLKGHEPYPALAVDRHWTLIEANQAVAQLMGMVGDATLLAPPVNVLRLSLHPGGLAPHIVNLRQWRDHLLHRLQRQIDASADAVLVELHKELAAYPVPRAAGHDARLDDDTIIVPLRLRRAGMVLSFLSTTTVFGTPVDITLSELALETFFPADQVTGEALRALAG